MKQSRAPRRTGGRDAAVIVRGSLPTMASGGQKLTSAQSVSRVVALDIPITPSFQSTTAGVIANSIALSTAQIPNFAARFGSTFVEYRLLGFRLRMRILPATGAAAPPLGLIAIYLDEKLAAAPTLAATLDHVRLEVAANSTTDKIYEIDWVANDLLDLEWTPVGTAYTPVWMKIYQDVANFGGANISTLAISGAARIQFRGLV